MTAKLVRDVMSRVVMTVGPNDKLATAADVMQLGRIRHMPVLDDGELCGLVSQRDLFHSALLKALGWGAHGAQKAREMFLVKQAMVTDVRTTTPDTPLSDAAETMIEHKLGCLPVLEGGKLVGIITESDFVALFRAKR
jgi:CBS domain-containing protein